MGSIPSQAVEKNRKAVKTAKMLIVRSSLLLIFFSPFIAAAQALYTISGIAVDASNNKPLRAATIRVAGVSNKGSIANERGLFRLILPSGTYTLVVSYLGYRSDSIRVSTANPNEIRAALQPEEIRMPEVVITDEDPAIEIIRRAIESKPKWMGKLRTFQCEAYSRNTITFDTAISAVIESYLTVYWRANDSLREVVHKKRQTRNMPVSDIVSNVGQVTNFNDDTIRVGGFRFVGPTAPDAFSFYDYKLLKTRFMDGMEVYDISVIPRSRVRPLFSGVISIAEKSYAVISVDFEPNEAYSFPFLKEIKFHYRQQFGLYEDRYWMPSDYRVQGEAMFGLAGLVAMKFAFNRYVVMADYLINPSFPDTVYNLPKLTIEPEAAKYDSTYWVQHALLPLNVDEEVAYQRLDSTQSLDKLIGSRASLFDAVGTGLTGLSYIDLRYNRVEGLFLGGKISPDSVTNSLTLRGSLGYGFSDKKWKYSAGGTYYLTTKRSLGIGVDVYRKLDHRPDENYYGDFQIMIGSLFSKDDYRDYFLSSGWKGFLEGKFLYTRAAPNLSVGLAFSDERQTSVVSSTDFSLLARDKKYRPNRSVEEGKLRALALNVEYGNALQYLLSNPYLTAHTAVEYSSSAVLGSEFNYTRISGGFKAKFPSYGLDLIFNPTLSLSFSGGIVAGTPTPQRLFDLESSYMGSVWFGALRGAGVKEFSGDRFVSLSIEHNFRRVPFLATGIPFLYKTNYELIVFGSLAQSWMSPSTLRTAQAAGEPTHGWYYEAGFGISRIFDLLRLDLTWRGKEPRSLVLTLGIADIL